MTLYLCIQIDGEEGTEESQEVEKHIRTHASFRGGNRADDASQIRNRFPILSALGMGCTPL